ncbi:hypothetical protein HF650_14650 [Kosakonia sp. SMBL-WEM22]|nr:hypothetical protein HF650_14650 [Kosakonia sp. SMBL-WEM22]
MFVWQTPPEQEARIGKIAADYLLARPDVLVQVSQKLQQQQREQLGMRLKVMNNQAALLRDADKPVTGPAGAKVAVIEFFDYQCVFCRRLAPGMVDLSTLAGLSRRNLPEAGIRLLLHI